MPEVVLLVGGMRYGGWTSISITRTIESISGSFDLTIYDKWVGRDIAWPIVEGDACRVLIDDQLVISGYVDHRQMSIDSTGRRLSFAGRDKSGQVVDCSPIMEHWQLRNKSVEDISSIIAGKFGVGVSVQSGLDLGPILKKFAITPGETGWSAMQRLLEQSGAIAISDGDGGIIITRAGSDRAHDALVQGGNIVSASVDYSMQSRYARYVVSSQIQGSGDSQHTNVLATAIDNEVTIQTRTAYLISQSRNAVYAQRRAGWEAKQRAASSETVSITVRGWTQSDGSLWPINSICTVRCNAIGVDGDMLIASLTHGLSNDGISTSIRLVRPDAFLPEPSIPQNRSTGSPSSGGAGWKELAGGV